jgi:Na+/melibiose symporter-like transporter
MLDVLRQRNFLCLWLAWLVSSLGDMVLFIALPFYVYQITGSTAATGATLIVETVPRVLMGSVAGVFVDRWDRRTTMIAADLGRAVILLPLIAVRSADTLWVVYVVGFLESVVAQFFRPARSALLPRLVRKDQLTTANALNAQADATNSLIGPAIGGAIFGLFGLAGVVLVDSFSFVVSAALIALIGAAPVSTDERGPDTSPSPLGRWAAVAQEWRDGLTIVKGSSLILAVFFVTGVVVLADGVANALFVPLVKEVLRVSPLEFGWMVSATGAGRILGLFLIGKVGKAIMPRGLMALGSICAGLLYLALTSLHAYWLVLGLLVLLTVPIPGINVGIDTLLQSTVADRYRGRVFGALGTTLGVVTLLGMVFSTGFGGTIGVATTINLSAGLYLLAGGVALALLGRASASRSTTVPDAVVG